jgi:ATP-dependent DNA helicase PIF1
LKSESIDFENTLHIFPLRKQVEDYNKHLLSKISTDIITITASHCFSQSDQNALGEVNEKYIPTDDRLAGGLCSVLRIAVNARVMLVRNIHTESGLVNGAMGTVTKISYETNDRQSEPTKIHVLFDDPNVGRLNCANRTLSHNPIPIECVQFEFSFGGRQIVRMQFPLVLSWGCTVHKVQGLSLDRAAIHLGSDVFEKGMAYVALSRVRSLQGLFLLSLDPSRIIANELVIKEYERLKNIIKKRN